MALPTLISEVDFEGNPTATYSDTVRYDDDTAAYWRMNSAATLADELGVNGGTFPNAPVTAAGLLEPLDSDLALTFDGVNDYAKVLSTAQLAQAGSYSLHGFIKTPAAMPGALKGVFDKGAYKLGLRSDGKLQFSVQNHVSGVSTITTLVSTTVLQASTKYHVVVVHDAANDQLRLYVNGMREVEAAHSVGTELWSLPLLFGARPSSVSPSFGSVGAVFVGAANDPWAVGAPASIAVGNLLIAHVLYNNAGGQTITPPAGWTPLYSSVPITSLVHLVYYKVAVAGDVGAANYSFDFSAAATGLAAITRFTGVDTAQPFANPPYELLSTAGGSAFTTGARLPQTDDILLLGLFAASRNVGFTSASTERYDANPAGLGGPGTGLAMFTAAVGTAAGTSVDVSTTAALTAPQAVDAFWIALKGPDAQDHLACTLDEWALSTRAYDDDDALDLYEARLSGVGTYTGVTADTREWSSARGRQYELDKIEAGTLSQTLNDSDRDYDPSNTASPHYPNVITKRRIRNRADVNGTVVPLWQGYIERFPPTWPTHNFAETKLTASDGLAPLALAPVGGITIPAGLTGAQIHRLLDKARWPRSLRAIDAGLFSMADWLLDDTAKAKESILTLADSELGLFFISAAGLATFHDSAHRYTAARSLTPQVVFTDVPGDQVSGSVLGYIDPVPGYDDDQQITEWQVATAAGDVATVRDVVAARRGFPLVKTRSTRLDLIDDAELQAIALLQRTARPALRFDSLTVSPTTFADWLTVLSLEISDRVTVKANPVPLAAGSAIVQDCFVEGVRLAAKPKSWSVQLELSPVSPAIYYDVVRSEPSLVSYYRMNAVT